MKIPTKWIKEYIDLPEDLKIFTDKMSMIGHMLDKTEETANDIVVDLELRGNRADCYSVLGIAREAHASFGGRLEIVPVQTLTKNSYEGFNVEIESPVVQRFYSVLIKGLKVGPSPEWLQLRLKDYGMDSINNIVDITNYVMIETGMPMHAFDLNRMNGSKLILRPAQKDELLITFDGSEKKLTAEDVVFGSEKGTAMGIAGVIGSKDSGIENTTVDILLECAAYDRVVIRKSIFRYSLHTEAGLRHSHDLSASLCDYALERATDLVIQLAGDGDRSKIQGTHDYYPSPEQKKTIEYNCSEVERLGGVSVDLQTQVEILKRLEFEVEILDEQKEVLQVIVPLFRTDIFEEADIVEEVLRIYGYENIPSRVLSSPIPEPIIQPELLIENKIRDILVAQGLNEVLTVPMATIEDLTKTLDPKLDRVIPLINPSSSDHTHLRSNMYTGLLQATKRVLERGDEGVSFFEVGKQYLKQDTSNPIHQPPHSPDFPYIEQRRITGMFSSKKGEWDFYKVKGVVEEALDQIGIKNVDYTRFEHPQYDLAVSIRQGEIILGTVGIMNKTVTAKNFDIAPDVFAFLFDVEGLVEAEKTSKTYMPYSVYPEVSFDMSIVVSPEIQANDIKNLIRQEGGELVRSIDITDAYEGKDGQRSILFTIVYQAKDRTLSLDEVNTLHQRLGDMVIEKFGVIIKGRENVIGNSVMSNSVISEETIKHMEIKSTDRFIVVGKIIEILPHPNADRLVICKIDVGSAKPEGTLFEEYLQIVTGAGNIKPELGVEGSLVPVALPGAVVKSHKTGETMTIKIGELRGEKSEGMLCSADELELPNPGYDGILILDKEKYSDKLGLKFEI
jgi:phenylalanyl-tRNA synthetase beta chain